MGARLCHWIGRWDFGLKLMQVSHIGETGQPYMDLPMKEQTEPR